jgi:hypothetical protein
LGGRNVFYHLPAIYYFAYQYKVDPKLVMAIVYYESDAAERLLLNITGSPTSDFDLWRFLFTGEASIGLGQIRVDTALALEKAGLIEPVTPSLPFGGEASRRLLLALRLTQGGENVRYIVANLAYLQKSVEENAAGLNLSTEEKMVLTIVGYNVGHAEIIRALKEARQGNREALEDYLNWPYAQQEILPVYSLFRRFMP